MNVSVIIPVFNGARYLPEAIGSVLSQQFAARQILVVDDGSTDGSAAVAGSCGDRVHVLRLPPPARGPGAARNAGVRAASGDAIAFLDADDLWEPAKLALQADCLERHPEVDLVFTHVRNFHSPDLTSEQRQMIVCPPDPVPGILPSALMLRAAAFERIGPFDENLAAGEMIGWMARAQNLRLGVRTLDAVLVLRRLHERNRSRGTIERNRAYLAAVKEVLDRRRGRGQ